MRTRLSSAGLVGWVLNCITLNEVTMTGVCVILLFSDLYKCLRAISFSPAGLIGWVPNCDTLHALIREYRDVRKIPLNVEHRLMLGMAPDYDHLTVIQKVEVFEHALESTSGTLVLAGWPETQVSMRAWADTWRSERVQARSMRAGPTWRS